MDAAWGRSAFYIFGLDFPLRMGVWGRIDMMSML